MIHKSQALSMVYHHLTSILMRSNNKTDKWYVPSMWHQGLCFYHSAIHLAILFSTWLLKPAIMDGECTTNAQHKIKKILFFLKKLYIQRSINIDSTGLRCLVLAIKLRKNCCMSRSVITYKGLICTRLVDMFFTKLCTTGFISSAHI